MKLTELLQRDKNNLDLFRVLAAGMVIYGHAYALTPQPGHRDFVGQLIAFDYSGSLAVKLFFFLSGLVVTNSLLTKRDALHFIVLRGMRIWPALLAFLVFAALIIGPALSQLSVLDYYSSPEPWRYIAHNLRFKTEYRLPGLFAENPLKFDVNGSLWTLSYEIRAYFVLLTFFLIGLFRSRALALGIGVLIVAVPFLPAAKGLPWLTGNPEVDLLMPCFAIGALLALFKDRIRVGAGVAFVCWLACAAMWATSLAPLFFYFALFATVLYLSRTRLLLRLKMPADPSYGMYLWGWPIQQTLAQFFPSQSIFFHHTTAIIAAFGIGLLSWHLLESKASRSGVKLLEWMKARRARGETIDRQSE